MNPIAMQVLIAGVVELVMAPVLVAVIVRVFGNRLDRFDQRRERAREELAEDRRQREQQRESEHTMLLAIARTMLLNNYERCEEKGFYSIEEREIYSKMYRVYCSSGGNGIIDTIAERIRKLPLEPPKEDSSN